MLFRSGERIWQSQPPGEQPLRSQDWGLIKMRPLVAERYVFVRLLYDDGPLLVCLDKENGQTVWSSHTAENVYVASDPFKIQGRLAVLTLTRHAPSECVLRLTSVNQDNGQFLRTQDLVYLRDSWWGRRCCEVAALGDGFVVALSGATLCGDIFGNVRWIRRHVVLPPDEEPQWIEQHFQRPMLIDNDLYVAQPGMRAVERLEVASGRLVWRAILPDVQRLIGMSGGRLIAQVDKGLLALDPDTGNELWRHHVDDPLDAAVCDDELALYVSRPRSEDERDVRIPQLSWLDSATGRPLGITRLREVQMVQPFMSPILVHRDHLWAFLGRSQEETAREIAQLIPNGQAEPTPISEAVGCWNAGVLE